MTILRVRRYDRVADRELGRAVAVAPTYDGHPDDSFRSVRRSADIGYGEELFSLAGQRILGWQLHRRAGMRVHATEPRARVGGTVLLGLGVAGIALLIPCRVNEVVEDEHRIGFSYRTLPGHPECGEEGFYVELAADGAVRATVEAVSRPGAPLVAAAGPVARLVQHIAIRRYLSVLG